MGNQQSIEGAAERRLKRMEEAKNMDPTKEDKSKPDNSTLKVSADKDNDGPCMKDKIDNLIEGYLLNSECSDSDMDDLPSSLKEKFNKAISSSEKTVSSERKPPESQQKIKSPIEDILTLCKKRRDSDVTSKDDNSDSLSQKPREQEERKEESTLSGQEVTEVNAEKTREKVKNVMTFQNMIEKVLSVSVNSTNSSGNLSSCENADENSPPKEPVESFPMETKADDTLKSGNNETDEEKGKPNPNKEDMSLSRSKVMYLKDHIEKILDNSFKPVTNKVRQDGGDERVTQTQSPKPALASKKCLTLEEHMKNIVYNELLKERMIEEQVKENKESQRSQRNSRDDRGEVCQYESLSTRTVGGVSNSQTQGVTGTACKTLSENEQSDKKIRDETLRKSSVEAIMDNIIKNAVNEQYTDEDRSKDRAEEMRKNIREVLYSDNDPDPPRLEKYDAYDPSPQILRPDEHFAESHKKLLEQAAGKTEKLSPNTPLPAKEMTYRYQGIPGGIHHSKDSPAGNTSRKPPMPMYSPQGQPVIPSPRQHHRQLSPGASMKGHVTSENSYNLVHPHASHFPGAAHKQEISLRDCQCVSCDQKLSAHGQCKNNTLPHPHAHFSDKMKQQSRLSPHVANAYFPPEMSQGKLPVHNRSPVSQGSGVPMAMAPGPSPNAQFYHQNSFRMPQLYPTHPPIPSAKEAANSRNSHPSLVSAGTVPQPHISAAPSSSERPNTMPYSAKFSPPSAGTLRAAASLSSQNVQSFHHQENAPPWPKSRSENHPNRAVIGQVSPPVLDLTLKRQKPDALSPVNNTGEQPLDLSIKKPKIDERFGNSYQQAQRTSSGSSYMEANDKQNTEQIPHIHHLQNSMDRFCHEARAAMYPNIQSFPRPPLRATGPLSVKNSGAPRPEIAYNHSYTSAGQRLLVPGQGHSHSDPYGSLQSRNTPNLAQNSGKYIEGQGSGRHSLPHPHNSHMMQQPIKSQHFTQQAHHLPQSVRNSKQPSVQAQGESRPATAQDREGRRQESPDLPGDLNGQRSKRSNSVSKHEPIQNIIGNHSPNDILYLWCRLCGQTYGSPYGFRKHFRNQHGFEPSAEHTIVHTISATKTARRGPPLMAPGDLAMAPHMMPFPPGPPQFASLEDQRQHLMLPSRQSPRAKSASPMSSRSSSRSSAEKVSKTQESKVQISEGKNDPVAIKQEDNKSMEAIAGDNSNNGSNRDPESVHEKKFLECPECGQRFGTNDFGSFKRHCRQHGHRLDPFKAASDPGASVVSTGQTMNTNTDEKSLPSSRSSSSNSSFIAAQREFKCKYCKELFLAPNLLDDHINKTHVDKPHKFMCLMCTQRFHLFYLYKRHMSKKHRLTVPENDFSCPDLLYAEEMSSEEKTVQGLKETNSHGENSLDLKFIPSSEVTRMSADTAVTSASPDSSSDPVTSNANKSESTSSVSKLATSSVNSETGAESRDSNSSGNDRTNDVMRQVSQESVSDNSQQNDDSPSDFRYMHKKFGSKRKMSVPQSPIEASKIKVPRTSLDVATKSPGNARRSPSVNSNASLESESSNNETKQPDTVVDTKLSHFTATENEPEEDGGGKYVSMKMRCADVEESEGIFNHKGEARHHLPFVWDRVTRTRAGKNITPPKYHT